MQRMAAIITVILILFDLIIFQKHKLLYNFNWTQTQHENFSKVNFHRNLFLLKTQRFMALINSAQGNEQYCIMPI